MTQNEITELAVKAGFFDWEVSHELIAFTELVAAKEREACERLRDHEDVLAPVGNSAWSERYQDGWIAGTQAYHEAIRARGQE